jgi:hypothetical protein
VRIGSGKPEVTVRVMDQTGSRSGTQSAQWLFSVADYPLRGCYRYYFLEYGTRYCTFDQGFYFSVFLFLASYAELAKLLLTIPFVDVAVTNLEFSGKKILTLGRYFLLFFSLLAGVCFSNGQAHAFSEFTGLHSRLLSHVLATLLTLPPYLYFEILIKCLSNTL